MQLNNQAIWCELFRLAIGEQRRKELYAKQGRGNQFTSRDDRDKWISKELKSLNKAIRDKEEQIRRLREDLSTDQKKAQTLEVQIAVKSKFHFFLLTSTSQIVHAWMCIQNLYKQSYFVFQEVTEKIDKHKEIIDQNNKSFYEMKKQKDALQNERKYVALAYACLQRTRHSLLLNVFMILFLLSKVSHPILNILCFGI